MVVLEEFRCNSRMYVACAGAVKITPAHDHNDYDVGKRHSLPFITIIDDEGNITEAGGPFKVWDCYNILYILIILENIHEVSIYCMALLGVTPSLSQW